jgi:sugar transferase EpsL
MQGSKSKVENVVFADRFIQITRSKKKGCGMFYGLDTYYTEQLSIFAHQPKIEKTVSAYHYTPMLRHQLFVKRLFDIIVSLIALILIAPTMLVLAILVRIKLGSPILFRHERPGLYGKPFVLYKFRTMTNDRDSSGKLLPDEERLTPFGKLLRSTSLDELPELFNVLKGEMSLVGPRPLMRRYLSRYTPEQARRQNVLPGITGWAQVNGRNAISWEQRFNLDVWYVDNQSILLDIRIMLMTAFKVLKREGIAETGHVTMSEFMGSAKSSENAGNPAA